MHDNPPPRPGERAFGEQIPMSCVRLGIPGRRGPFPGGGREDRQVTAAETNLDKTELPKVTVRTLVMFADDDLTTLQHAVEMF